MNPQAVGIIGIALLLVLIFMRMPLGAALIMVGVAGFCYIVGVKQGLSVLCYTAYRTVSTYDLTVIPLFLFMGVLAGHAGLSTDAFHAANKWLGHQPGGLAMATVGACTAFGAVCGSAIATAATMCTVALPEMRKYKYADRLSLGTIACGGLLGFMIPPSNAFIIYAIFTEVSIGSLFMAGVFPGLLIAFLFMAAIYITCRRNPSLSGVAVRASWRERVVVLSKVWGIVVLFVLVMGGMYGGLFTPTEAGAVGAFGTLALGLAKRQITWKGFIASLSDTARVSGMILFIIVGANTFNYFVAITEVPFWLAQFVGTLPLPTFAIMLALLLMYIILGFIMDIIAVITLTVPIIYPVLLNLGIDPVWFGVLVVLTIMIGNVTPPVGIVVYSMAGIVKDVPLSAIFRGVWPYLFAMLAAMAILIAFPQISLWLPNMMIPG